MGMTVIRIHPEDNVAVAAEALPAGQMVRVDKITVRAQERIPAGHKIALTEIKQGSPVVKYGYQIGKATVDIHPGDWVHLGNLSSALKGIEKYSYHQSSLYETCPTGITFKGFLREDGEAGIRNEVWIINTVGCVNQTADKIARVSAERHAGAIDGIFSFSHPFGCSQLGGDLLDTQKILAGLVHHPNAGAVLVLGLGCENNNIDAFKKVIGPYDPDRVAFINAQDVQDECLEGQNRIDMLVRFARRAKRSEIPLSKLRVGLKCGGSDAFSGITANPLLGRCSNRLIKHGASLILSEVPEMFGAEMILINRCANLAAFEKTSRLLNCWKQYYMDQGQPIDRNPSPGNQAGGITTLEEKSLGCVQKAGMAPVTDVLEYGGKAVLPGLNLLSGPGNDLVSATALAAAGAQLILFSTGMGTPLGAPVPTVKIASTSRLYNQKKHWIDFDAGPLLDGVNPEELENQLFSYILEVANGSVLTLNERNGYREIGILKKGVFL